MTEFVAGIAFGSGVVCMAVGVAMTRHAAKQITYHTLLGEVEIEVEEPVDLDYFEACEWNFTSDDRTSDTAHLYVGK